MLLRTDKRNKGLSHRHPPTVRKGPNGCKLSLYGSLICSDISIGTSISDVFIGEWAAPNSRPPNTHTSACTMQTYRRRICQKPPLGASPWLFCLHPMFHSLCLRMGRNSNLHTHRETKSCQLQVFTCSLTPLKGIEILSPVLQPFYASFCLFTTTTIIFYLYF